MSVDDEIRRKQVIIRQQMQKAAEEEKLRNAWINFSRNSPFHQNSPVVEHTPLELQAVFYELMPKFKYKNPKIVLQAPDQTTRAAIPGNNGSSNRRSFDITLYSTGSGKDLKSLGIWFFSIDNIAFVRNNNNMVSWDEIKAEGITPDIVRDKTIEAIALLNINNKSYSKGNTSSKKSGCYIATAVYGSYDCPEVWMLRRYRDNYLMNSFFGRLFVKCYYLISPALVKRYSHETWFKKFWTNCLNKKIHKLKLKGYSDEKYYD